MTKTTSSITQRIRTVLAVATLAFVATAACGGDEKAAPKPKPTTTTTSLPTTVPGTPSAPLTGLPVEDPAVLARPALMVKIDNAPKGRPQEGILQADVIVEGGVEGGITRLAAIFHSQLPDSVGPVRSARTTDILIATQLNRPLFAWSGANADFVKLVRSAPLVDVGIDVKKAPYRRQSGRPALYSLWANTAALYEGVEGGPPPPMFSYRGEGEAVAGEPATKATMEWRDKVRTSVEWEWDAASSTWRRKQNGTAHVDIGGNPVAPKNVVIQMVTYHDTGYRDRSNTIVPEADLVGEGDVWLLSEGKVVRGRWKKAAADQVTQYLDAAGAPMKLTPGQTWLELPKPGTATVS